MGTLVVYESMFGATKAVAEALAEGLEPVGPVRLVEVSQVAAGALAEDVSLLVVGGPTHAFGMSRASTRADAEKKYGPVISRTGVREWLEHVQIPAGLSVAAFGTKVSSPLAGSAARGIAQRLRRLGGRLVLPAQDFFVNGAPPGSAEGSLDGARSWGARLATAAALRD